jgi:hypothetical protein
MKKIENFIPSFSQICGIAFRKQEKRRPHKNGIPFFKEKTFIQVISHSGNFK